MLDADGLSDAVDHGAARWRGDPQHGYPGGERHGNRDGATHASRWHGLTLAVDAAHNLPRPLACGIAARYLDALELSSHRSSSIGACNASRPRRSRELTVPRGR